MTATTLAPASQNTDQTAQITPTRRLRSELTSAISEAIFSKGWNQVTAAKELGRTQPDVSNLHRGVDTRLSLDALLDMALRLDIPIRITTPWGLSTTRNTSALGIRHTLMAAMVRVMSDKGQTLVEAAAAMNTNIQRISDIRSGREDRVSLPAILTLAETYCDIHLTVDRVAAGVDHMAETVEKE